MQMDLHFAGMYVLCRISGMKSKDAEIVAYSSQYVDDAVFRHALKFRNGGIFKQTMTAHRLLSPKNFDVNEALEVWMPFHFVPCGENGNPDALVTTPNSKAMSLLLEDIASSSSSHILYRLGIGLHCFADAFAHHDFKGFYDPHNDVHLVQGVDEKGYKDNAGRLSLKLLDRWCSDCFAIGHGEVLSNPDIPYAEWVYSRGAKTIHIKNLEERYLPAVKNIYEYLVYFLAKNPKYSTQAKTPSFDEYIEKFRQVMSLKANGETRYQNWLEKIHENYFEWPDFDEIDGQISYDEKYWFSQAVEAVKVPKATNLHYQRYNYHTFRRKEGFEDSHWVKFMQSAAEHQFLVIHCILPELGLIVG